MSKCKNQFYVPLRVRSWSSLLKGGSPVARLIARARSYDYSGMALTDENNLYSAFELFDAAIAHNMRPILGAILSDNHHSIIALVENERGYSNLCRLISQKRLNENFDLKEALADSNNGLLFLIRNPVFAELMVSIIPRDRLWLECCRPMTKGAESDLWGASSRLNLPVVATTNVLFADRNELSNYRLMAAVRRNCRVTDVPELNPSGCYHLPPPDTIKAIFSDIPGAVKETLTIAERCSFHMPDPQHVFPTIPKSIDRLRSRAYKGAVDRFGSVDETVVARLEEELELLTDLGFADYFLVVDDIVQYARSIGTSVAGRGSGANSLVAFCLGITNVDPLRYNLQFARFLNRGRSDYPDLDLDFCWRKRDDVIDYVFKTYGDDRVAMVSTMSTLKPRAAFRLTAKALGHTQDITTKMQRILSTLSLEDLSTPTHPCWQALGVSQGNVNHLITQSRILFDRPHHLSLHPGGVIITPDQITNQLPLQRSAKGVVLTQYDKDMVKRLGLVKIDLLGNRSLSAAGESIRLIRNPSLDIENLRETDEATAELLRAGNTLGIGQLESPLMRQFLKQLKVSSPYTIMQALALVRPGPASLSQKETFIRRARGIERAPKNLSQQILNDTYGLMLFEDDALTIIRSLTGLPVEEADRFRRQVSRCSTDDERKRLSDAFIHLCNRQGHTIKDASEFWVQMSLFNGYSFCRGHAASYAKLAWFNAYVKAHHPLAFWVSALNNIEGFYDKWVYVEEAKRQGIHVLKPDINRSQPLNTAEGDAIRLGLMQIRGLSRPTIKAIIDRRPFESLEDLSKQVKMKQPELKALTLCNALSGGEENKTPYPEQFRNEWEVLGVSVREHPIQPFRAFLRTKGFCFSSDLRRRLGTIVSLCGIPATSRSHRGKDGKELCFFTLSDEMGIFEVRIPSELYDRKKMELAQSNRSVLCVSGIPEDYFDTITVRAKDIKPLNQVISSCVQASRLGVG